MKYIRTKDGRIYLINEKKTNDFYCVIDNNEERYVPRDNWLDSAYTIEELCDEAVFFDKDNEPHYKSKEGNIWYLGASLFTESLRFGIFTDKGLIYVAKMNDKGELELL